MSGQRVKLAAILVSIAAGFGNVDICACGSPGQKAGASKTRDADMRDIDLIDSQGTLSSEIVGLLKLDREKQARLQRLIDGQRRLWVKMLYGSILQSKDQFGNLLVEIPDLRREGKRARERLYQSVLQNFAAEISDLFEALNSREPLPGPLKSLSEDWFRFGEPAIYIFRGGERDSRRDEIGAGEIWIQYVEPWDTLEGGYDYSIYLGLFKGLSRELRELISRMSEKPYVGPAQ